MDFLALSATLGLDTSAYEAGLEGARTSAGTIGESIKGGLLTVAKVTAAGAAAAAGAIGYLTKESVTGFAEYEQLVGGVETLFSNLTGTVSAAPKVLANANNAFRTAGLSASEYMETVTSFSAALVSSLNNDYDEAARVSDMAITDMSDNANKMGTSMEAIQTAYSGFAKQNYTMLDNLKLGYGGTKEEMERLLSDAEKFSGVKYNIDNLNDVYEAIHVIQGEMGISGRTAEEAAAIIERTGRSEEEVFERLGTTAKEANETISGSLGQLKGAWSNLITGLSTDGADLDQLIANLVDSAEIALGNLIPVVEKALSGIGGALVKIAPIITSEIPKLISQIAPSLGNAVMALFSGLNSIDIKGTVIPLVISLAAGIRENAKRFSAAGISLINNLINGFRSNESYIVITAHQIFESLLGTLTDNIPYLFEAGLSMLQSLGQGIGQNIPTFLESVLPLIEQFSEFFRQGAGQLVDVGIDFILNLVQGIMDSLPMLIEQVPQIIINFAGAINDNAPKLLEGGVKMLGVILMGIINSIPTLIANIPKIFEAILAVWTALNWINLGKNVIEFIKNGIDQLMNNLPQALKDIGNKAIEWFKGVDWANAGTQAIDFIKSAILGVATKVPETVLDIANKAWEWFNGVDWYSLGSNIINGIVNGLNAGIDWIKEKARSVAQSALDAAKNALGIESPSKVFRDEVGKMITAGLSIGIDQNAVDAINSAEKLSESLLKPFDGLEAPIIGVNTGDVSAGTYQTDLEAIIAQIVQANDEAMVDRMYEAMLMVMQDGGFTVQLDGREVGRLLRENGVITA